MGTEVAQGLLDTICIFLLNDEFTYNCIANVGLHNKKKKGQRQFARFVRRIHEYEIVISANI